MAAALRNCERSCSLSHRREGAAAMVECIGSIHLDSFGSHVEILEYNMINMVLENIEYYFFCWCDGW